MRSLVLTTHGMSPRMNSQENKFSRLPFAASRRRSYDVLIEFPVPLHLRGHMYFEKGNDATLLRTCKNESTQSFNPRRFKEIIRSLSINLKFIFGR